MNKSLFEILFDYRGEINHNQFICGILAILFIVSLSCSHLLVYYAQVNIMKNISYASQLRWNLYYRIIYEYIPSLIPYSSIIFYCCIILTIKRMRTLGYGTIPGIISGIIVFIGFKSIVSVFSLSTILLKFRSEVSLYETKPIYAFIFFLVLFLIGLSTVLLIIKQKTTEDSFLNGKTRFSFLSKDKMDEYQYIKHIAFLQIFNAVLIIVMNIVISSMNEFSHSFNVTAITFLSIAVISVLVSIVLYTMISIQRIRDISLHGNIVPRAFIIYLVIMVILSAVQYYSRSEILSAISSLLVYLTAVSMFVFQFFLVIAPSEFAKEYMKVISTTFTRKNEFLHNYE